MAVLIDPPLWPAHQMLWSHLVSDTSYEELHRFAALVPLPRRGFDIDHYDVPEHLYAKVISLGAIPVSSRDLVHALRDARLRVKARDRHATRPARRRDYLVTEWTKLYRLVAHDITTDDGLAEWNRLGAQLLVRWNEPHRRYHAETHLEDVLLSLDHLSTQGEVIAPETLLAAWFHDAIYTGVPGSDETNSAHLATITLSRLSLFPGLVRQVGELIVATTPNFTIDSAPLSLSHLLDADLSIFAAGAERYQRYKEAVREEYLHVPDWQFRKGRRDILQGYLATPSIYRTKPGRQLWEQRARQNLKAEIETLYP